MKKQLPLIIVLGLLLLGVGITGWAVSSGNLVIQTKNSKQELIAQTKVCDDTVVASYNKAIKAASFDDYKAQLEGVVNDVNGRADNSEDPTCVFILYKYYLSQNQAAKTDEAVATLKRLSDEGNYPSNKLADIESIDQTVLRASTVEDGGSEGNSEGGAG